MKFVKAIISFVTVALLSNRTCAVDPSDEEKAITDLQTGMAGLKEPTVLAQTMQDLQVCTYKSQKSSSFCADFSGSHLMSIL